jgi:hypothetical protein
VDWTWGIQLLLACGLLFVLVGVLWPKLKTEEPARPQSETVRNLPATVLPLNKPQLRYAEQVDRAYRRLFGKWLQESNTGTRTDDAEVERQKAA